RPVLRRLADVPGGCVFPDARERFLVVGWQQALVDTYRRDARFGRLFVEWVHHLLVIEAPRIFRWRERVTDCVGLPRIGLVDCDSLVDLFHPTGLLGRDDRMGKQSP